MDARCRLSIIRCFGWPAARLEFIKLVGAVDVGAEDEVGCIDGGRTGAAPVEVGTRWMALSDAEWAVEFWSCDNECIAVVGFEV